MSLRRSPPADGAQTFDTPSQQSGERMEDKVFKHVEVTGTSSVSLEEAIQNAIRRAGLTVRNLRWFEVVEIRGAISEASVSQWQVTIKIGFVVED